jgi:cell wall-associated NlpC family hydrolase
MTSPIVNAARQYLGVRFRHRGRSRVGLDCAGLTVLAYRDCGVEIQDFRLYGPEPHRDGLTTHATAAFGAPVLSAPVRASDLLDGDVVVMRFRVEPHHLAIVAEATYGGARALNLIHADGDSGRVLEYRLTPDMVERITHVHRRPV